MKIHSVDCSNNNLRELGTENKNVLSTEAFNEYYTSGNYETYFIEYFGDIASALSKINYADVYITDKFFAILFVEKGMLNTLLQSVPEIIAIQQNFAYTLSELIIDKDISKESIFYPDSIPLNGEGVVVGIVGAGVDYLSPRFITEAGDSRILSIWDQTINTGPSPEFFPYGTEYTKENIDTALKTSALGKSPYEIVPHKDDIGHGTAIAGIIGGRNLGGEDRLKSIVPKCEFAIVKLEEARESVLESAGIEKGTKNVYQSTTISSAIRYLSDLQVKLRKPMVVYLPLGSNFGGRDGESILERYIDNLTQRRNFLVATNTGNQGNGRTHTSGTISSTGDTKDILINISESQRALNVSIFTRRPDIISISITSPKGDTISKIPIPSIAEQNKYLTFEENSIRIDYFAQETLTGAVSISILIKNTIEGLWKISLFGDYIVSGIYDAWIPQSELLKGDTRLLNPDPYTTLLIPSTSINAMVTSYYNQIENTIAENSGRGYPRNGRIEPAITIEGLNLLTCGLEDSLILGSGAAMAGAILAGAVALVFQWGIVQGNYPDLTPPRVKNFLIASAVKDDDKIYPNQEWGFGKLSLERLYEVLYRTSNINIPRNRNLSNEDEFNSYLYINIPEKIYKNINK